MFVEFLLLPVEALDFEGLGLDLDLEFLEFAVAGVVLVLVGVEAELDPAGGAVAVDLL